MLINIFDINFGVVGIAVGQDTSKSFTILFINNELCEFFISIGWTMELRMIYDERYVYIVHVQ